MLQHVSIFEKSSGQCFNVVVVVVIIIIGFNSF